MTKIEILDKLKFDVANIPFEVEKLSSDINFKKNDVRYYFYGLFQNTINQYYLGWNMLFFFEEVDSKEIYKLYINQNLNEFKKNHIEKLFFIQDSKPKEAYQRKLNGNLILSSFSSFETCINLIFEKIATESDKRKIILDMNLSYLKKINKLKLNEVANSIIEENILKSTFIPLVRKFRYLINNVYSKENKVNDIKFIEFISEYRNCLSHNNGIYSKDRYEAEYFGYRFLFEKGKDFFMEGEGFLINWKICFEMKEIFTRLISNLDYKELIEYPD